MTKTAVVVDPPVGLVSKIKKIKKKKIQVDGKEKNKVDAKAKKVRDPTKKKKKKVVVLKTVLPVESKPEEAQKKRAPVQKELEKEDTKLGLVTRAGIRRCATRAGIRCIQRSTVSKVKDIIEEIGQELMLRARSNAYNISRTKTLRMVDIASAARNMGLGNVMY